MSTVHWVGTGLSTVPGLRRLISTGQKTLVWNRTVSKAEQATAGLRGDFSIQPFSKEALAAKVTGGDLVLSMLPGTWHIPLAELALEKGAHFVSSSYISDEMRALDQSAKNTGLCVVNEVGLDPGIDHLLAHSLVQSYTNSAKFDPRHAHYFRSYCGGVPKIPNDFGYKFSWSPLGVLKALKSPARCIANGQVVDTQRPWDAITNYTAVLPSGQEVFEAYPNRDSTPFMSDYHFGEDWNVQEFVRGTLRLNGWAEAWRGIFDEVESLEGPAGDARLQEMSNELWSKYAYDEGEPDRVVLCVELEVRDDNKAIWHQSYAVDAAGDDQGSAMARLVSIPVSLAIEEVLNGQIDPGVSAAPSKPAIIERWLKELRARGDEFVLFDHLNM